MIEVKNLTKVYGDKHAVDDVSFSVSQGEILGFLGPNGAGKSTTMNILTGYISSTSGEAKIDGFDILENPIEAKRKIGYLPEHPPLYLDMTVQAYLEFVYQLKKVKIPMKEHINDVCRRVKIQNVQNRIIKNLSKGYRQRVGLAQALLGNPDVLILDEPTVGLDPKQIIEIRDLIRSLGKEHTVILSSHILSEVSAICDHIMIISHGNLVASDSPEGLRKLMSGSMELELTVRGRQEELEKALEAVPGVDTLEKLAAPREDFVRVKVIPEEKTDIREKLFYALAEAHLPIMEMTVSEKSLEDIFLELTRDPESAEQESVGKKLFKGRRRKKDTETDPGEENDMEKVPQTVAEEADRKEEK